MAAGAANDGITGLDYDQDHVACAPTLTFSVEASNILRLPPSSEAVRRLIAAVDSALARRADGPDLEALDISLIDNSISNHHLVAGSLSGYSARHGHAAAIIASAQVAEWLRFAERRVTGSFTLAIPPVPPRVRTRTSFGLAQEREFLAVLPASARAQTMSLTLGNAGLTVPAAAAGAFHALTDLFLSHVRIEPGSADEHNLGRLLSSSCCPRLRRLRLQHVGEIAALRLDAAGTLEELWLVDLEDVSSVEVDAQGLRELHMIACRSVKAGRISTPRLEALACSSGDMRVEEFTGLGSVRRLEEVVLRSHGYPEGHPEGYCNAWSAWLLEQCAGAVERLGVSIWAPIRQVENNPDGVEEMMKLLPRLAGVTELSMEVWVTACVGPGHRMGGSAARLIAHCSTSLQRLSITINNQYHEACTDPSCFCSSPAVEMSQLEHLREANIAGFLPSEDQLSLVRLLIAKAPALERMTVQFEHTDDGGEETLPRETGHWAPGPSTASGERTYHWTPAGHN